MITRVDSLSTLETEHHYLIVPSDPFRTVADNMARFALFHQAEAVPEGFCYTSDGNDRWLTVGELRQLISDDLGYALDAESATT